MSLLIGHFKEHPLRSSTIGQFEFNTYIPFTSHDQQCTDAVYWSLSVTCEKMLVDMMLLVSDVMQRVDSPHKSTILHTNSSQSKLQLTTTFTVRLL